MSLVALLRFGPSVLLVGDVLLTRDGEEAFHAIPDLPAMPDVELVLPRDWCISVTALREKVLLVSEGLGLGWVGSPLKAESVVRALRQRWSETSPSSADLAAALEAEVETTGLACEVAGWLREGSEWLGFRWDSAQASSFQTVDECFLGSGQDMVRSVLSRPQVLTQRGPAIHRAALIAALLGLEESLTGETIRARFGGGVQVIYDDGSRLRQLDSLTIGLALITQMGEVRLANRVLKYGRSGSVAFVGALDATAIVDGKANALVVPIEPLVPPDHPIPFPTIEFSLRADVLAFAVRVRLAEGDVDTVVIVPGSGAPDLRVAVDDARGERLVCSRALFEHVIVPRAHELAHAASTQSSLINFSKGLTIFGIANLRSSVGRQVIVETGHAGSGPCARLEISPEGFLQLTIIDRANQAASAGVPAGPLLGTPLRLIGVLVPLGDENYELQLFVNNPTSPSATARAKLSLDVDVLARSTIGAGRRIATRRPS